MNVDNQVLMHIKAGTVPAQEMLEFLMSKKPNAVGYVVQEAEGKPLDVVQEDGANLTVEDLHSITHEAKDLNRTLYFASLAEGHDAKDVQPFCIDDPDGNKFISIMLEGDIVGNTGDKAHTEHYNLVNGVLIPSILEICDDFEGDLTKIMAKLRKDTFSNAFFMHVGERAVLHIMPMAGEPFLLAKNKLHKPFDWGWVSHAVGFGEKAEAPAAAEAPRRRGFGRSTVRETVSQAAQANAAKPTLSLVPKVEPKKEEAKLPDNVMVKPPEWLHKNSDVKYFYEQLTGVIPSAWKKKIAVKPKQNMDLLKVNDLDEFNKYRLAKAMQTTGGNQTKQERLSSTATPGEANPPPLPANPPAPDAPIHGPVDPTPLPIIDKANLQKVLDLVATLDHNSKEMMDPKEIQQIEAKIDKFSAQVGLKGIHETMNWKVSDLFALAATDPKAAVLLLIEWRAYARPFLQAELKAKVKDNVPMTTETTTTQLTPSTTKTESVARPARSGWGKRRNVA